VGGIALGAIGYAALAGQPSPPGVTTTVTQTVSGTATATISPTATAALEPVTVMWEEGGTPATIIDAYVKETGYPVKIVPVGFDVMNAKIVEDMINPTPTYDIVQVVGSNISRIVEKGDYLLPLEDTLPSDVKSNVDWDIPSLYYLDPRDGKKHLWGISAEQSYQIGYYNSEMFDAAGIDHYPKTYDEVVDFAPRLTKSDQQLYGICLDFADDNMELQWKQGYCAYDQYMYDKDTGEPVFNNDAGRTITNIFRELWSKKAMNPESINIDSSGTKIQIYANGKAAFIWSWSPLGYAMAENPDSSQIVGKTKFGLPPGGPLKKVSSQPTINAYGVVKNSKRIDRAMHFINWMSASDDALKAYMGEKAGQEKSFGLLPNKHVYDLYADRPYMSYHKAAEEAWMSAPRFDTYFYRPWTGELIDIMNRVLKKAVTGDMAVNAALDQSVAELKEVMKTYGWPEKTFNP
jgi:ABC-type glycerol-3-phosphate transport system substrate-binding protein